MIERIIKTNVKLITIIFLSCPIFFSQTIYKGTFIVIFKFNDTIFVAADSKAVSQNYKGLRIEETSLCKIGFLDNIGYAIAGVSMASNGFDISVYCRQACRIKGNIFQKAARFREIVESPLRNIWQNSPEPLLPSESQVAFFGFYMDKPIMIKQRFIPSRDTFIVVTTLPKSSTIDSPDIICLGVEKALNEFISISNQDFVFGTGIDGASNVVKLAIKAFPDDCGEPINTLICTKNGFQWISKHQPCN